MPRVSDRQKVLKELDSVIKRRRVEAAFRLVSYDSDDRSDTEQCNIVEGRIDNVIELAYNTVLSQRYLLQRKPYRKGFSHKIFERDLQREDNPDDTPPWLKDDEFVQKYRMNRDS
jgi:vacuolar-type H+-ATPase subunit I/STV1